MMVLLPTCPSTLKTHAQSVKIRGSINPNKKAVRLFKPDGFLNQGEIFSYERESSKIKPEKEQHNRCYQAEALRFS